MTWSRCCKDVVTKRNEQVTQRNGRVTQRNDGVTVRNEHVTPGNQDFTTRNRLVTSGFVVFALNLSFWVKKGIKKGLETAGFKHDFLTPYVNEAINKAGCGISLLLCGECGNF